MDSPSQMMQARQQLQSQVMQLSYQQNEMAHHIEEHEEEEEHEFY